MNRYRTISRIRPYLPDGRLIAVHCQPGELLSEYTEGHIHPALLANLSEYFRMLSHSGVLTLTPDRGPDPPDWLVQYDRVDPDHLPLRTFGLKTGRHNGLMTYNFFVRADMMSSSLVTEMNEEIIPAYGGLIRYAPGRAPL